MDESLMKGSPTGILVIGVGVFIIVLGFTGVWSKVFEVMRGAIPTTATGTPLDHPATKPPPQNQGGSCNNSTECPSGYECIGNMCSKVPNKPPDPSKCTKNGDCPSGQVCRNGKCQSKIGPGGQCEHDNECPSG